MAGKKRKSKQQERSVAGKEPASKKSPKTVVSERLKKSREWSQYEVKWNLPNTEKMSEVILKFAEPLIESAGDDDEAYKKAIGIAVLVWNASIMPDNERDEFLNDMAREVSGSSAEDYAVTLQIIDLLLSRKRKYFQKNNRFIAEYDVKCTKNDRHLAVASTNQLPVKAGKKGFEISKKPWWKKIFWWR